jgi:hypothetical protein
MGRNANSRAAGTLMLALSVTTLLGIFNLTGCDLPSQQGPSDNDANGAATQTSGQLLPASVPSTPPPAPSPQYTGIPTIPQPSWTPFPSPTPVPHTPPPIPTLPPPPPTVSLTHNASATVVASVTAEPRSKEVAGTKIAWGAETSDGLAIWIGDYNDDVTPAILNRKAIARWETPLRLLDLAPSPDGQSLAVLSVGIVQPGEEGIHPTWLSVINLTTNSVQSIPDYSQSSLYEYAYYRPAQWILGWLDNERLAIQQTGEGAVIATKDGASYSRVTIPQNGTASETALSPDRITLFSTVVSQDYGLWLYGIDGSNPLQILDYGNAKQVFYPKWSPDGKFVSFLSPKRELKGDLYVTNFNKTSVWLLNIDTKTQSAVSAEDAWSVDPAWSIDSSKVAYLQGDAPITDEYATYRMPEKENTNIFTVNITDLKPHRLTNFDQVKNSGLRWSPSDSNLVLSSTSGSGNGLPALVAVSAVNGTAITLLSGSTGESLVHPMIFSP